MRYKKKVLFIVNGFGLGNSTRCHALIQNLQNEYEGQFEIEIVASGNSYKYFEKNYPRLLKYKFNEVTYGKSQSGINFLSVMIAMPQNFIKFFKNSIQICFLFKKYNYDFVIIDSDYTALIWRIFYKLPICAINNSLWIKLVSKKLFLNKNLYFHFFIEHLDFLFHKYIPTVTIYPSIALRNFYAIKKPFVFVQPLIRSDLQSEHVQESYTDILVLPSSSNIGLNLEIIKKLKNVSNCNFHIVGFSETNSDNLFFYEPQYNLTQLFSKCGIVISNAGWSTICEIITYDKIGILIPIESHSEQIANCLLVKDQSNIIISNSNDILNAINNAISMKKIVGYQQNIYPRASAIVQNL